MVVAGEGGLTSCKGGGTRGKCDDDDDDDVVGFDGRDHLEAMEFTQD